MAKLFFTQADFGTTSISCFFSKETFEAATARKNETFNSAMNQVSGKGNVDEDARKRRAELSIISNQNENFDRIGHKDGHAGHGFNIAERTEKAEDGKDTKSTYLLFRGGDYKIPSEEEGYKIMNILDKLVTEARVARKSILSNPPGLTKSSEPVFATDAGSIVIKGSLNDTVLLSPSKISPEIAKAFVSALNSVLLQDEVQKK